MINKTYTETRLHAARIYELRGNEIHIRYKERAAQPPTIVNLGNVRAGSKRRDRMINPAPLKRAGLYLGCIVMAAFVVTRLGLLSPIWSVVVFGIPAIPGVRQMIYWWIPFSTEQYHTKAGALAFDIIRGNGATNELDEFMKAIDSEIRRIAEQSAPTQ